MDADRRPPGDPLGDPGADASAAVTRLYQAHAVGLIRLAIIMLGDRAAAAAGPGQHGQVHAVGHHLLSRS